LQYQQGPDEFKEKKKGNRNYATLIRDFAWVMENMGSPGIIDLLFPGLASHGIFKTL